MFIATHLILKWLHIIALVYWLGGEWGIFQISYNIVNPRLNLDERKRHLETAYRIDILARVGILLLLPLGFQMGYNLGVHPFAKLILPVWIIMLGFIGIVITAYIKRGTPFGIKITLVDEKLRYILIPILFCTALWSLINHSPFTARWFAAKMLIYSLLLVIGLVMRFIMRHWTTIFIELSQRGSVPALELQLEREVSFGRKLAYLYWFGIASVAFIGVTKPWW